MFASVCDWIIAGAGWHIDLSCFPCGFQRSLLVYVEKIRGDAN